MSDTKLKKFIAGIFSLVGLRLVRIPGKQAMKKVLDDQSAEQASKKYGWLMKYGINKIVDIGANDGHFAYQSSLVFSKAQYFCFEPIPKVFEDLKSRFIERENFTFLNYAVGEVEKTDTIYFNEYSPSSSMLEMSELHKEAFVFTKNAKKQEIKLKPLDGFIGKINPDRNTLIKIDVQGYEKFVINGGLEFIKKCKILIIEMSFEELYKNQSLFHEIYLALYNLGYAYHGNIEQLHHPRSNEILQADCLFVNQKI